MSARRSVSLAVRYSRVPWLWDIDLDEGPKAIWDVEHQRDHEKASCWEVPLYEPDRSTRAYLVLHATRGDGNDGGEISLSISGTPRYDKYAQDVLPTSAQNRARRYVFRSDWITE